MGLSSLYTLGRKKGVLLVPLTTHGYPRGWISVQSSVWGGSGNPKVTLGSRILEICGVLATTMSSPHLLMMGCLGGGASSDSFFPSRVPTLLWDHFHLTLSAPAQATAVWPATFSPPFPSELWCCQALFSVCDRTSGPVTQRLSLFIWGQ